MELPLFFFSKASTMIALLSPRVIAAPLIMRNRSRVFVPVATLSPTKIHGARSEGAVDVA